MPLERQPSPLPAPPTTLKSALGWVRLTLDDINDVLGHLSKSGYSPVLVAGNAIDNEPEAESLKSATDDELKRVVIGVTDKAIGVYLYRARADVEYRSGDPNGERVAGEIVSLLRPRRVPGLYMWTRHVLRFFALFGTFVVVFMGITLLVAGKPVSLDMLGAPIMFGLLLLGGISILLGSMSFATERKAGGATIRPYFLRERREVKFSASQTVWIAVFAALVSGIGGSVATWLLTGASQ